MPPTDCRCDAGPVGVTDGGSLVAQPSSSPSSRWLDCFGVSSSTVLSQLISRDDCPRSAPWPRLPHQTPLPIGSPASARSTGSSTPSHPSEAPPRCSPISPATRHRTAITNTRLIAVDADSVAFTYKDYRCEGRRKIMRLAPDAFIHRFLLHVLPDSFHRIRHYGFLANGHRAAKIERCRKAIAALPATQSDDPAPATKPTGTGGVMVCRDCGGLVRRIGEIARTWPRAERCDTSGSSCSLNR